MISLIITTCDRPTLLVRAISSVVDQKFISEVIVVDDGNLPLDEVPEHVVVINSKGYTGVCRARNKGLEAASNPYIAFLDDDDTLHPDAYCGAMDQFAKGVRNIVVSNVDTLEEMKTTSVRVPPSTVIGTIWGMDNEVIADGKSWMTKQSAVYETVFLRSIGGFQILLKSRSQSELFLRISQHTDITGISHPCYQLNRDTGIARLTGNPGQRLTSLVFVVIRHAPLWMSRRSGWRWFARELRLIRKRISRISK